MDTFENSEPTGVKQKDATVDFQELIKDIQKALTSEKGKRLCCKVAKINNSQSLIIYQGLKANVWARINNKGDYFIYRSSLEKLLKSYPSTRKHFT